MPYPVLGVIPPDALFGDSDTKNVMMNFKMTADEKVEELQNILDQRDHSYSGTGKENDQNSYIKQLEFRLNEVMKVNKALIDELHDKNYVNQDVKTRLEQEYLQTENQLEAKISNVIEKMGSGIQDSNLIHTILKNETLHRNSSHKLLKSRSKPKRSDSSSDNSGTPKSIQGTYASTFEAQMISHKNRNRNIEMISNPNLLVASKPVNKKSSKHYHKPKATNNSKLHSKSSNSQKKYMKR